jgi:hypothetical protein
MHAIFFRLARETRERERKVMADPTNYFSSNRKKKKKSTMALFRVILFMFFYFFNFLITK